LLAAPWRFSTQVQMPASRVNDVEAPKDSTDLRDGPDCPTPQTIFKGQPPEGPIALTTLPSVGSTMVSNITSHQLETSGCVMTPEMRRRGEIVRYVHEMRTSLLQEIAQGQGERINTLTSLIGCDKEVLPRFGTILQSRFASKFDSKELPASELVERIDGVIDSDPFLRSKCPTIVIARRSS
jgi:hypothetical protein